MSVSPVSDLSASLAAAGTQNTQVKPAQKEEASAAQESGSAVSQEKDSYVSTSGKYKMDAETVNQLKANLEADKLRFIGIVQSSLTRQIFFGQGAWKDLSEEDLAKAGITRADLSRIQSDAQAAISEDGYWGVKQTSERMVSFAKALVGGDPSRVEEMRSAFIKGFKAAEKVWGGALPDISQKTYDATMKLFDEWAGISSEEKGEAVEETTAADGAADAGKAEQKAEKGEQQGGSVVFNEGKRAQQLAAVRNAADLRSLVALLNKDLTDCKAGLEKGWCDRDMVGRVEAMIRRAQSQMGKFPDGGPDEGPSQEFLLSGLM